MATNGQDTRAGLGTAPRLQLGLGLAFAVGLSGLSGCDDPLPGFANPPPVDAGADSGADELANEDGG